VNTDNSISKSVISFFGCVEVSAGVNVVADYPSVSCDSDQYNTLIPLFGVLLAVMVVGGPILLFSFLLAYRKRLGDTGFMARFSNTYLMYKPDRFFWMVSILIRYCPSVRSFVRSSNIIDERTFCSLIILCDMCVLLN
jgi:hypothetical protein